MRQCLLVCSLVVTALLCGCAASTRDLPSARPFSTDRYLGRWYELVRYDHVFERGLERVSADYVAQPNGEITVINQGWRARDQRWQRATGSATPAATGIGELSVTFFWPFYGAYRIVALDPDYRWSIVTSSSRGYLWILHRDPTPPEHEVERLIDLAQSKGFSRHEMIRVVHDGTTAPAP